MIDSVGRKAVQAFDELGQAPAPRRALPLAQDEIGATFPYGSEWFFGYTYEEAGGVYTLSVHNVALHYHSGVIQEQTTPYDLVFGTDIQFDEKFGFSVDFVTGAFTLVTGTDTDAGSIYANAFTFPIYEFTASDTGEPVLVTDYIHGSNLAW